MHIASLVTIVAVGSPVVLLLIGYMPTADSPWWFSRYTFHILLLVAGLLWLPAVRYQRVVGSEGDSQENGG